MTGARSDSLPDSGTVTVAAVPTEDAADTTARLGPALSAAGVIAAADPGLVRRLAAALGVTVAGRVVSCVGRLPSDWVAELLAELTAGQDVLVVTAAGLADDGPVGTGPVGTGPEGAGAVGAGAAGAGAAGAGAADAGAAGVLDAVGRLVEAAAAAGIRITVLPGPSPVTAALAVAGLPAERFTFEGVPPRRAQVRERLFAELAAEGRTLIFAESPSRVGRTLAELAFAFGASRAAAVCRGLATAEEDVVRGPLGELAGLLAGAGKAAAAAQVTIVVAGAPSPDRRAAALPEPEALAEAVAQVLEQVADGATTRDAVAAVAERTGLRKRDLYNAASRTGPSRP
jgi:16S rRNA (cytidine1402-2'-O)-methyltransferase